MRTGFNLLAIRWLLAAGLALSGTATQAQNGVTITQSLETSVKVGMSSTEVEGVLGRPAHIVRFRDAPGPTWMYHVVGSPFGMADFEVSYGADGKVLYASERILGGSGR